MAKKEDRNFTIQGSDIGFSGGLYVAKEPLAAAKKAGTKLFQMIDHAQKYKEDPKNEKYIKYKDIAEYAKYNGQKSIKFLLRESTQGSKKKSYFYEITQKKLSVPKEVTRGKVTITVNRETTVKSCKESHDHLKH